MQFVQTSCSRDERVTARATDRFIFVLFIVVYVEAQQITITTSPVLPEKIVATGLENLLLISTITGSPLFCSCRINDQIAIFYENNACLSKDSISNDQYGGVCSKTENVVTFTFTIKTTLRNDVNYEVNCAFPISVIEAITVEVQD